MALVPGVEGRSAPGGTALLRALLGCASPRHRCPPRAGLSEPRGAGAAALAALGGGRGENGARFGCVPAALPVGGP